MKKQSIAMALAGLIVCGVLYVYPLQARDVRRLDSFGVSLCVEGLDYEVVYEILSKARPLLEEELERPVTMGELLEGYSDATVVITYQGTWGEKDWYRVAYGGTQVIVDLEIDA